MPMNNRLMVPRRAASPAGVTLYFNDAEADSDWSNVLNWWTDEACTVQASSIPTAADDAILLSAVVAATGAPAVCNTLSVPDAGFNGHVVALAISVEDVAAFFGASSLSFGTINGNVVFNGNAGNDTSTINGNAVFNDITYNTGDVNGNATFNDNSENLGGTITGTITCNTTGTCTPQ